MNLNDPPAPRINEAMVNSYFELEQMNARPIPNSWQNVARLCFHSAQRFQRKRVKSMKSALLALPPNDVLALSPADVRRVYLLEVKRSQMIGQGEERVLEMLEGTNCAAPGNLLPTGNEMLGDRGLSLLEGRESEEDPMGAGTEGVDDVRSLAAYVGAYEAEDFCRAALGAGGGTPDEALRRGADLEEEGSIFDSEDGMNEEEYLRDD